MSIEINFGAPYEQCGKVGQDYYLLPVNNNESRKTYYEKGWRYKKNKDERYNLLRKDISGRPAIKQVVEQQDGEPRIDDRTGFYDFNKNNTIRFSSALIDLNIADFKPESGYPYEYGMTFVEYINQLPESRTIDLENGKQKTIHIKSLYIDALTDERNRNSILALFLQNVAHMFLCDDRISDEIYNDFVRPCFPSLVSYQSFDRKLPDSFWNINEDEVDELRKSRVLGKSNNIDKDLKRIYWHKLRKIGVLPAQMFINYLIHIKFFEHIFSRGFMKFNDEPKKQGPNSAVPVECTQLVDIRNIRQYEDLDIGVQKNKVKDYKCYKVTNFVNDVATTKWWIRFQIYSKPENMDLKNIKIKNIPEAMFDMAFDMFDYTGTLHIFNASSKLKNPIQMEHNKMFFISYPKMNRYISPQSTVLSSYFIADNSTTNPEQVASWWRRMSDDTSTSSDSIPAPKQLIFKFEGEGYQWVLRRPFISVIYGPENLPEKLSNGNVVERTVITQMPEISPEWAESYELIPADSDGPYTGFEWKSKEEVLGDEPSSDLD